MARRHTRLSLGALTLTGLAAANVVYEYMSLLALGKDAPAGGPAYGESNTTYGESK